MENDKIKVKICVGSSCHLNGSYDVIESLKDALKKHNAEDKIELAASFCLGNCLHSVSLDSDGVIIHKVTKDNAEEKLLKEILPLVKK